MKIEYVKINTKPNFFAKIKKYSWQIFLCILLGIISIFFILNSSHYILITLEGIILYGTKILPALLPFLFVTKLLSNFDLIFILCSKFKFLTKFLFNTPQISFYIFFMSIISGYPVGAKLTSEFHEKGLITAKDAEKILSFCSTSGPLFVIGSVGVGFFVNTKIGLLLFFVHIISSIINGIIFGHISFSKIKNPNKKINKKRKKHQKLLNKFLKNNTSLLKISKNLTKNIKKSCKINKNLINKKHFTIKNNIFQNKIFHAKSIKIINNKPQILTQNHNTNKNQKTNINETLTQNQPKQTTPSLIVNLDECMYNSIRSVLIVGGFVIIFYVFLQIILDYNLLYPLTRLLEIVGLNSFEAQGFTAGIFEITKGISILSKSTNIKISFILSSFLISFSGISIILQSFAFLNKTKISKKIFIFQKFCHAIISAIIAFFVAFIFL